MKSLAKFTLFQKLPVVRKRSGRTGLRIEQRLFEFSSNPQRICPRTQVPEVQMGSLPGNDAENVGPLAL